MLLRMRQRRTTLGRTSIIQLHCYDASQYLPKRPLAMEVHKERNFQDLCGNFGEEQDRSSILLGAEPNNRVSAQIYPSLAFAPRGGGIVRLINLCRVLIPAE